MHLDIHQALVPLLSPVPLRLQRARGTRVRSLAGTLWVTIDGEQDDHVLARGESLVIDSDAPVLVSPLSGTATVGLCDQPQPAERPLARLLHALWPVRPGLAALPAAA
ncbi:MAG: DUF2917 domain-containing protein [Pseudomonadota bacterium]